MDLYIDRSEHITPPIIRDPMGSSLVFLVRFVFVILLAFSVVSPCCLCLRAVHCAQCCHGVVVAVIVW
jgi:hypothetical protein